MDWYEKNIEPGVRDLVRLLRDNGVNTECSCEGHGRGVPYIQCQCVPDGELQRIHEILANAGYGHYAVRVWLQVQDGHVFATTDVYVCDSSARVTELRRDIEAQEEDVEIKGRSPARGPDATLTAGFDKVCAEGDGSAALFGPRTTRTGACLCPLCGGEGHKFKSGADVVFVCHDLKCRNAWIEESAWQEYLDGFYEQINKKVVEP